VGLRCLAHFGAKEIRLVSFNYVGGAGGAHNPLVINLAGDCASDISKFENNEIHLNFKNVPLLDGLVVTPDLDVIITH
jgi:hypothetical protein